MQNIVSFMEVESYIARVYAGKRCAVKPYFLTFNFGDVTGSLSASSTVQQKVQANADFILSRMSVACGNELAAATLQILDGGTSEQFFSAPVSIWSVCDSVLDGQRDMCTFRRIAGNSLLTATIQNPSVGTDLTNVKLTLSGVLVYVYSGQ